MTKGMAVSKVNYLALSSSIFIFHDKSIHILYQMWDGMLGLTSLLYNEKAA